MSYGAFATKPAFNAGRVVIPPPTRAGMGQFPGEVSSQPWIDTSAAPSAPLPSSGPDSGGPSLDEIKQIASNNAVDPALIDAAAAKGADPVQLMLMANGGMNPQTELATLDMINQDVGSSNYPSDGSATGSTLTFGPPAPAQPTDWGAWIQSNAWWLVGLGAVVFLGPSLIKKL